MARTLPDAPTSFQAVSLPAYLKNSQQFESTKFYTFNHQTHSTNIEIDCRYEKINKATVDTLIRFYYAVSINPFTLPANYLKFPNLFLTSLQLSDYWVFVSAPVIEPKLVNTDNFISNLNFKIKNVGS